MDFKTERSEAFSVALVSSTQRPPPPPWNTTATLEELTLDSNFAWLLCALFFAISWVVYITYYNSRIIGFIITKILNRIYPNGYIKIGSFCVSVLSGKIMFRDVAFINEDFTIRAQDGWLIFCWWKPYFEKDISDDLSHCETRLSVMLNGLELHVYNRSQLYTKLERLFGLESKLKKMAAANSVTTKSSSKVPSNRNAESGDGGNDASDTIESQQNSDINRFDWKDLVPVIKIEISMGRLVFGNRLLPTTLSVSFEEAIIVYTSKPASSRLDLFTHICKCTGENFKVLLAPSPKYTGMTDEPPRYMGEGFVVLQSNYVDLYYYQDEPGKVSATLETVRMANGDIVQKATNPLWGLDIKCGKGTDFSYGPWADRQREQLFKFFFPQEYQTLEPTIEPKIGELRRAQAFDLRLNTLADATVDILFSKEKETNAIHMNVGPGSYLEATIPWLVKENGYMSRVCGQLLHLDASTSLQYRSLVESETLQFDVKVHYPLHWNDQQEWQCTLTGCKTTVHLIYSHKVFFQALMEDWASKSRPDILRFVPYTWHFSLILKEFELILVTNEHNWIDCSSQLQENAQLAICGELFDLSFDLPFVEFLPPIVSLKFWIQGECVALSAHIPEANPSKTSVLIMEESAKLCNRDGSLKRCSIDSDKKWRNVTTKSSGWVECWTVPIVALSITYSYYPAPPLGIHGFDMDITTPEKEEILLSPIRPNKSRKTPANVTDEDYNLSASQTNTPGVEKPNSGNKSSSQPPPDFDPTLLAPDKIQMELEIGPSVLKLYGALLCYLIQAKDNYLGENQAFTDFSSTLSSLGMQVPANDPKKNDPDDSTGNNGVENKGVEKIFDPRHYRPLDVIVSLTLHDIHGHIMKACSPDDPPCPFVNLERLCLELHKTFNETRLQLLLSPLIICVENQPTPQPLDEEEIGLLYSIDGKSPDPKLLNNISAHGGHLVLSALQVRAHAMFSNCNRTLSQETLEYAWLVEVQLGDLTGRLTAAQLQNLLSALEMFTFQAEQVDSVLQPTRPYRKCQHDLPQALCPQSNVINNPHTASKNCCSAPGGNSDFFSLCPCPEDVKYRMTRLSLDAFDLCLVDKNTALELEAGPVRLSTCNLHGQDCCSGFSLLVQKATVHQYIATHNNTVLTNTEATAIDTWLEVGQVSLGPIILDGATSHALNDHWIVQDKFLKIHDFKTKRLWFLWPDELELLPKKLIGKCGCIGGCSFYGSDQNHTNFFDISDEADGGQCHFSLSNSVHSVGGKLQVCGEDDSYGFGKSLLYQGEYVFDVQGGTSQEQVLTHPSVLQGSLTFTEGYLERSTSKTPDLSPKHHSESSMGHGNSTDLVDGIFSRPVDTLNRTISTSQKEISLTENSYHGPADRSASSPLVPSVSLMSASTDSGENEVKSEIVFSKSNLKASKPEELNSNVTHWHGGGSRRSLTGLISDSSVTATRGISPRSVRRAISTESTHSSEAYFSADEESSSSVLGDEERTTTAGSVSSSGSYPQEIITGNHHTYSSETFPTTRVRMAKFGNGSLDRKIHPSGNRQSLEDIEEKPSLLRHSVKSNTSGSSDSQTSASSSGVGGGPYDHSNVAGESNSVSSSSFISAVSSQEDVALVDLHNQMEKEIVESPVLMSCYTTHLTHVQCHHWNTPLPLPHLFHNEPTSSSSSRLATDRKRISPSKEYMFRKDSTQWKPKFIHVNEGFTSIKLIGKNGGNPRAARSAEPGVTNSSWNRRKQQNKEDKDSPNMKEYFIPGSLQQHYKAKRENQDEDVTSDRTIYRNTIVVKVEGDINATISPLMLDSLKKFLETLVPVQYTTHPLTILNHLHKLCAGHVIWQNQLKKEKLLYLCQLQNQKLNSAGSMRNQHQNKINFRVMGANKEYRDERHSVTSNSDSVGSTTNYEEIRTEHTQAFLDVAAINVSVLQAAIVEEVIAFSALDNVKDLTCASLLAVRLDNIFVEISKRQHTHRALQTFAQSKGSIKDVKQRSKTENFGVGSAWKTATRKKGKDDSLPGELVTVELKNEEEAEVAFSTKVGCVHSQLRRLRNSSSILKEAVLTVIPSRRSKVGFTFETPKRILKPSVPSDLNEEEDSFPDNFGCSFSDESERFGFIMFECGLEDVTVKFLRSKQKPLALPGSNLPKEREPEPTQNPDTENADDSNVQGDGAESASGHSGNAQGDGKEQPQDNAYRKENITYTQSSLAGDLSSLVVEFKTVWLNFAAPPKTPNTRKIDFTRLDWHLLSTATPSINAWLKSGNRFQEVLVTLIKTSHRRTCAVLGCLMADALDRQDIHMPVKSKFLHSKLTPLAKTLQEDPSCQLLMVLKRYLNTTSSDTIEKNIQPELVPPIQSLKRGIVALGRQWKNILYMPLLMEQNYRLRRNVPPYSVSFIAPDSDQGKSSTDEDKVSLDECEVTDETTNLLMAEGGSIFIHPTTGELYSNGVMNGAGGHDNAAALGATKSSSTPDVASTVHARKDHQKNEDSISGLKGHTMPSRTKKRLPSYPPRSSRASVAFPLLGGPLDSPARYTNAISKVSGLVLPSRSSHAGFGYGNKVKKNHESQASLQKSTTWSLSSIEANNLPTSIMETPRRTTAVEDYKHNEDLYNWMARQRDDLESNKDAEYDVEALHRQLEQEPLAKMFNTSRVSPEQDEEDDKASEPLFYGPVPSGLQLADAHEIFAPLFSHLGIEDASLTDSYPFNVSKKFGNKISVCCFVEILKVDIVESEYMQASSGRRKKKRQANGDTTHSAKFMFINTNMDTPAFVCNKFTLDLSLTQKLDIEATKREPSLIHLQGDNSGVNHHVPHHHRHHFTARTATSAATHSYMWPGSCSTPMLTTVINFTLNATYIAQQVNMPVLRLLHQFASMYQNVVETKLELKSKRARSFKDNVKDHLKKSPSAGTESQAESSRPHSPQIPVSSATGKSIPTGRLSMKSISGGVASLTAGITRTHSLSQKLRTTCNLKGYTNLQEALSSRTERPYSPLSLAISEAVAIDIPDSQGQSGLSGLPEASEVSIDEVDGTTDDDIRKTEEAYAQKDFHPHCWKTMYHLLKLYEFRPETKTVINRIEIKPLDVSENYKGNGKYEQLKDPGSDTLDGFGLTKPHDSSKSFHKPPLISLSKGQIREISKSVYVQERVPLIAFGVIKARRVKLLATLSGLKLETELNGLNSSLTVKERTRGVNRRWSESSLTGQLGQSVVSVLEGVPPTQGVVVKMSVGKSQTLYSSLSKSGKVHNSGLLTIGPIEIDIPQHPVALHGMMTRSSRQLSTTLQELRSSRQSSRSSRQMEDLSNFPYYEHLLSPQSHHFVGSHRTGILGSGARARQAQLITPIVIQFSIIVDSLTIGAALLPSLKAQYKMGQVTSMGITGSKAKFTVDLPKHTLSFNTNIPTDANLPSSASVDLPPVHISAEYIQDNPGTSGPNHNSQQPSGIMGGVNGPFGKVDSFTDGVVLRQGNYLSALAEIGSFEHCLTTDLLNHLVLVQKVFMKEVNEVLQKMSGGDKIAPLWNDEKSQTPSTTTIENQRLLFSVQLRLKGIQITATTPTSSAVRLETGVVELQVSNRVQNMSVGVGTGSNYIKLFGKAQVDINLSLGQLLKNALFEEAEPEFQQFAYFKTRICMRNALQDEMISSQSEDKEAVLITLIRPLIYLQPVALDKAVLVWLNYKNAYEFWNEQRSAVNKEELLMTQQLLEKVPQISQLGAQSLGTLFLQLTVKDMGICLPLSHPSGFAGSKAYDTELKAAVVVTLESTRVSACSCQSLVSKARFTGLCIRFADDFETSLDDWKPDPMDSSIMNLCVVSEGTYEICSQTLAPQPSSIPPANAKWILNVQWQMEGVDIHVDTNIGKQLSALFKTLTALTGEDEGNKGVNFEANFENQTSNERRNAMMKIISSGGGNANSFLDVDCMDGDSSDASEIIKRSRIRDQDVTAYQRKNSLYSENTQGLMIDPSLEAKKRSRLIEKEMNEQAKIINDLRLLGASQSTIEQEMKRLQELEAAVFNDFRRDVIKKLRRQSVKATSFKDKLGLGSRLGGAGNPLFFPDVVHERPENSLTELDYATVDGLGSFSQDSSPSHDQTRTGSVDISDMNNLSPEDKKMSQREPSLDSVFGHLGPGGEPYSETSTPSHGLDGCSPSTLIAKLPESQKEHVPTSPSTLSSSETDQDYPPVVLRSRGLRGTLASSEHNQSITDDDIKSGSTSSKPPPTPEPSIDFELDVKVFFNSGKCVFHTKDSFKDDDQSRRGTKKERSFSGGFESSSPSHSSKKRHGSGLKLNASSTKLRYLQSSAAGQIADFTIFLIPGLDVKVHYNSKTVIGESLSVSNKASNLKQPMNIDPQVKRDGGSFFGPNLNGSGNHQSSLASSVGHGTEQRQQHVTFFDPPVNTTIPTVPNNKKPPGVKKASLFAWMTLQSIPEEAVVSPHILDFLEQALEPIPLQITKPPPTQVPSQTTLQAPEATSGGKASAMVGAATSQYAAYASFPVDVIVYFRMQPSIVRFSCLPVSRVECLLRLPSVDLVFSSKRAEDEPFPLEGTPSETPKTPNTKASQFMRKESVKPGSEEGVGGLSGMPGSVAGGLSMTGCLADFSLYIFHPYGGAKKPGGSSSGGSRDGETSPLATSERKDSLSLQVEFVKVNISRSRKMNISFENPAQASSSVNQSSSSSSTSSRASQSWSRRDYGFGEDIGLTSVSFISVPAAGAVIRFSAVCDIGSASFKYDMRRLTEILAFPKAWYRRSIARRMFLGDQSSTGALYSDQDDSLETSSSSGTLSPSMGKPEFFLSSTPQTASDISSSVHTPGERPAAHSCPTAPLSAFDQLLLMNASPQHPSQFSTPKNAADILAQAGESRSTSTSLGSNSSSTGSGSGSSTNSSVEGARLRERVYSHPASLPSMLTYGGQGGREGLKLHFRDTPTKHGTKEDEKLKGVLYNTDGSPMHVKGGSAWETLVLFAVSLSRLNVQMNMGNVMGNTTWLTRDFKSQGRLSIGSSGHKNLLVSVGLEGSSLDSKGGIVGGAIELSQIDTYIHLREDYGQKPDHKVALKLAALEAKLDYMGTSVLMSRVSSLDINLKDEWQINNILQAAAKLSSMGQTHHHHHHHHHQRKKQQASSTASDDDSEIGFAKHPTKRPALIFVHGILGWDQLQLLISKSTTTDLMKMYTKLEEFFSQQFHSSKRVFSSLQTAKLQHHRSIIRRPLRPKPTEGTAPSNANPEARHHRHWQKVLALVSGLQMTTLPTSLPTHGTILGGTMELRGNNISLACFHGINFRSKSWAIFSLKEPNIVFSTEAQEVIDKDGAMNTHIVQNLSFGLGQQSLGEQGHHHHQHSKSMATVCKISRNVLFPPQFKTMQEWFHYSFSTSDLDDVNRFPVLEHEREAAAAAAAAGGGNVPVHDRRASVATSKGPELSHNQEVIFALPSLQFHLKTEHFQTEKTPTINDPKPTVECSFVTEFDDHIFVSVDAEAFFFLHDLITSYIKEKDSSYSKTQSPDSDRRRKVADPTEALQKDWRDYVCHTWHLEPTVRLQSWAGKGFEPYGVDYILQKLGFSHARVTIPKWTQRGCMDPLDKILSVVMKRMLSAVKEEKDVTTTASDNNP